MIVYHRLSDYTSEHKDLLQGKGATGLATINNRTNVLVYIAKQDRYRIIRGYFTPYQIEEAIKPIREKYEHLVEADIKELSKHKPYFMADISHIPPNDSFQTDEQWTFEYVPPVIITDTEF